jgi:hypothetical protein
MSSMSISAGCEKLRFAFYERYLCFSQIFLLALFWDLKTRPRFRPAYSKGSLSPGQIRFRVKLGWRLRVQHPKMASLTAGLY